MTTEHTSVPIDNNEKLRVMMSSLRSYFRSGWAFLIPYLAAYLLYAWLELPVNPVADGERSVEGISENASVSLGHESIAPTSSDLSSQPSGALRAPPLLYIYWALHAIHVILAGIALWSWFKSSPFPSVPSPRSSPPSAPRLDGPANLSAVASAKVEASATAGSPGASRPDESAVASAKADILWRLIPWFLLGLIFYIPGIYLEWPSDPWDHLRRINEWHAHSTVLQHSAWFKSSYFLPFSLTGHTTGLTQLSWLDCYYTAICLLVSWQYYWLARAVGLNERASVLLVILQALLSGNNIFSFYRYYGLSSSIFAQLGAVALTRIALQYATQGTKSDPRFNQNCRRRNDARSRRIAPALRFLLPPSILRSPPSVLCAPLSVLRLLLSGSLLLLFVGFNHIQGVGIAGLGVSAIIIWRLIEWKRSMIGWLALVSAVASIVVIFWLPRHATIDEVYRTEGWLTAWYGLNLFSLSSPAFDRALQIFGVVGILNLFAAAWLLFERHSAAWLTLASIFLLSSPIVAIPFLNALTEGNQPVLVFHRMLFAVPVPLALVVLAERIWASQRTWPSVCAYAFVASLLLVLVLLPPNPPSFGRLYHLVTHTPKSILPVHLNRELLQNKQSGELWALPYIDFRLRTEGFPTSNEAAREIWITPAHQASDLLNGIRYSPSHRRFVTLNEVATHSQSSTLGFLSGHWPKDSLAASFAGQSELKDWVQSVGYTKQLSNATITLLGPSQKFLSAYHNVELSPSLDGDIMLNPLVGKYGVLEIRGTGISEFPHRAEIIAPSGFAPSGNFSMRFANAGDAKNLPLHLKAPRDYRLLLNSVDVFEYPQDPPSFLSNSRHEEGEEIIAKLKIATRHAPGGLFIHIPLERTHYYHIQIQGKCLVGAPSLRVSGSAGEQTKFRYYSLSGLDESFTIHGEPCLELLIYQDEPFEYELQSLRVLKLGATNAALFNDEVSSTSDSILPE